MFLKQTYLRIHKVMRKTGFTNISSKTEPYYPSKLTSDKNGYEIRYVINLVNFPFVHMKILT